MQFVMRSPLISTPMRKPISEEPEERDEPPSRSQRKREVGAITELGAQLTRLKPTDLKRLDLDEDLLAAIAACAPLRKSARNRQIKLIGKMLRSRDHEAIKQALAAI